MAPIVVTIIASACTLIVGALIGCVHRKNVGEKAIGSAEQKAKISYLTPRISPRH